MKTPITFRALGQPTTQGSMAIQYVEGQPRLKHASPGELARWRSTVRTAALAAVKGAEPIDAYAPVKVTIRFTLARPITGHGGRRKDLEQPTQGLDLDKLCRAVLDSLTLDAQGRGLWRDDGAVVALDATKKYAGPGELPGAEITVEAFELAQRSLL